MDKKKRTLIHLSSEIQNKKFILKGLKESKEYIRQQKFPYSPNRALDYSIHKLKKDELSISSDMLDCSIIERREPNNKSLQTKPMCSPKRTRKPNCSLNQVYLNFSYPKSQQQKNNKKHSLYN